jgi:flagellar L-ring protein precursor FlgH
MIVSAASLSLFCGSSGAQTLLSTPPAPAPVSARDEDADTSPQLKEFSLTVVETPKPKTFAVHDLVTIVISENSKQTSKQTLDTKKDTTLQGNVNKFPDISKFFTDGLIQNTQSSPVVGVDMTSKTNVKGDGKYTRDDSFTDRITAEVIDVKPNGRLVLEARRTVQKDEEIQTLVLSGDCRREDVTNANTVLSTQLLGLTLVVHNEGNVKDAADKGWITNVLEAVFNF